MAKRLTYDHVKHSIEKEGYELLSDGYKNDNTKLKIQCSEGHIFEMRYRAFYMGQRCPTCARIKRGMLKRNTFQCVKRFIENEGYKLISKEYKNAHTKLQIKCPEEHRFEMKFNAFQQGQRCPECAIKRNNDLKRFDYKDVKNYIESFEGYKLLSEEYIGSNTKLKIQCSEGHIFKMTFACFKNRGQRCPKCFGNKRLTNQEIIDSLIFCENIRENKNEEVEVTCAYCGEWFIPKRSNLTYRILYVNGEKK